MRGKFRKIAGAVIVLLVIALLVFIVVRPGDGMSGGAAGTAVTADGTGGMTGSAGDTVGSSDGTDDTADPDAQTAPDANAIIQTGIAGAFGGQTGAESAAAGQTQPSGSGAEPGDAAGTGNGGLSSGGVTLPSGITVDLDAIPPYDGSPNVAIHDNVPFFTEEELTDVSFETYGELDSLGRCTYAFASIGQDLMPTEKRESISQVRPTGWTYDKYDGIDGNFLYNRCHLIAFGLTAENANERNLITGTRYMNTAGMNDLENELIGYIRRTGHHVLYRVTPVFTGDNLVADGVIMEARSVEADDISFCVYAYNVQPGIKIDYKTGKSSGAPFTGTESIDHSSKTIPTCV